MATQDQEKITLGRMVCELVGQHFGEYDSAEDEYLEIGKTIQGLIAAAVKAALPGRQSEANTKAIQNDAQKAFARKLARKVKSL